MPGVVLYLTCTFAGAALAAGAYYLTNPDEVSRTGVQEFVERTLWAKERWFVGRSCWSEYPLCILLCWWCVTHLIILWVRVQYDARARDPLLRPTERVTNYCDRLPLMRSAEDE